MQMDHSHLNTNKCVLFGKDCLIPQLRAEIAHAPAAVVLPPAESWL